MSLCEMIELGEHKYDTWDTTSPYALNAADEDSQIGQNYKRHYRRRMQEEQGKPGRVAGGKQAKDGKRYAGDHRAAGPG